MPITIRLNSDIHWLCPWCQADNIDNPALTDDLLCEECMKSWTWAEVMDRSIYRTVRRRSKKQ